MSALPRTTTQSFTNLDNVHQAHVSYAVALGCLAVGLTGWIVELLLPGTTALNGLLPVGMFYLLVGMTLPAEGQACEIGHAGLDRKASRDRHLAHSASSGYHRPPVTMPWSTRKSSALTLRSGRYEETAPRIEIPSELSDRWQKP